MTAADSHGRWSELAAGYALGALEPDDEQDFLAHLADCRRCQQELATHATTAASMAHLAELAPPPTGLWERIEAAASATTSPGTSPGTSPEASAEATPDGSDNAPAPAEPPAMPPPPPTDLPRQRPLTRRALLGRRVLAAAAATMAILAGAGWLAASQLGSSSQPTSPVAACAPAGACIRVPLTGTGGEQAYVLVHGGQAWLVATGLPQNDPARDVYVLWQMPRAGRPVGVVAFDVTRPEQVASAALAVPYDQTSAFAVSREPGHTIPAAPSHLVALGAAPS